MFRPITHLALWGLLGAHSLLVVPAVASPVAAPAPADLTVAAPAVASPAVATSPVAPAVTPDVVPAAPTVSGVGWDEMSSRAQHRVDFELMSAPTALGVGHNFPVTVRINNTTGSPIENLQITARRGGPVSSAEQGQQELAHGQFPFYGGVDFLSPLQPAEQQQVSTEIATSLGAAGTLAMDTPGVYPIMLTLTGTIDNDPVSLAEERFLLTVVDGENHLPLPQTPTPPDQQLRNGVSLVYPLSAELPIVPGEVGGSELVMANDNLAAELAPGGRLDELLTAYEEYAASSPAGAVCVAVDPALLDTVDRMSAGYTVATNRPPIVEERKRLRDSWFMSRHYDEGTPGSGSAAARDFLERVRTIDCLVATPWANTSLNAVAQTGNKWLMVEASERGSATIERVLHRDISTELVVPAEGYVSTPTTTPALVAANSTWSGSALPFDPAVGALLAQTGDMPQTAAYTDPWLRYDYTLDSATARNITAAAAVALAGYAAHTDNAAPGAGLIKLPNYLDPATARAALGALAASPQLSNFVDRELAVATSRSAEGETADAPATAGAPGDPEAPAAPTLGAPFGDPSAFTQPEITRAAQQARYTDELTMLMVNTPEIAMTRYGFTLPIRRELLAALTMNSRVSKAGFADAERRASAQLDTDNVILRSLRDAVSLIPPGNVYTRASESSPLLIVAENRLPLPVRAHIRYEAADPAVKLTTPEEVYIPAQGSITVTMTAKIPPRQERSDVRLWLTTEQAATISKPVTIAVQTQGGMVNVYGAAIAAALVFVFALILRTSRKKKRGRKLT